MTRDLKIEQLRLLHDHTQSQVQNLSLIEKFQQELGKQLAGEDYGNLQVKFRFTNSAREWNYQYTPQEASWFLPIVQSEVDATNHGIDACLSEDQ